jgi:hypothetical protein
LHPDILAQQAGAFVIVVTFGLPTVGQRKLMRHTINNVLTQVLRMAPSVYGLVDSNQSMLFDFDGLVYMDPR